MSLQSTLASQGNGLRLLSLDAGGTRSISQLKILVELMHQLNFDVTDDQKLRPCDVFDMIGGSGSGGFTAILLVILRLSSEQALDEFIELSVNLLERCGIDAQASTTALNAYIQRLLEKYGVDKERCLVDSGHHFNGCKLVVPISYKHHVGPTCTLRNFDVRKEQALNLTIAEALHATLATPPLFTSTSIFKDTVTVEYIGADLTLSNPTREIIAEAFGTFGEEALVACLLSVGGGYPGVSKVPHDTDLAGWNSFLERLATDSERKARTIDSQMGHLGLYYRFCVNQGLENVEVTNIRDAGVLLTHTAVYLSETGVSRKMAMCVDRLKVRDGVASLEQLALSGGQAVLAPTLPPMTRTFVMRKQPWVFIEKAIFGVDNSRGVGGPRMLAVTGIGGCGKTQMVLKFLQVHRQRFELCLFVDGSSAPQIRADVVRHFRSLGIAHFRNGFEECLIFLSQPSRAGQRIIVYDNVDDPALDLTRLLPRGESCAIIVTSRNHLLGDLCPGSHLKLDIMSMEEAIELLLYSVDRSTPITEQARKDASAIAEALGRLPIALQQARSYMSQTKCSAKAYLERLGESRDELLAQPAKFQLDMAAVSTYVAFGISFERLPLHSQKFFRLLSCFHWSNFPLELVILAAKYNFSQYRHIYSKHGDEFQTGKAMLEDVFFRDGRWGATNLDKMTVDLQNYSLITCTPGVDTILVEMHPLAHGWVKSSIPEQEAAVYQSAAILLLALGARNEYTSCAQYLTSHVNHLSPLWDQLHINNAEAFGDILNKRGLYEGAVQLRERVATELRNQAEPDNVNIANSIRALALSYRSMGRSKDAEPLQREALRLMTDVLGNHHPDTITASGNLALTYYTLGRLKDAELLQEQVLNLTKEILGERHPDTVAASNNLALIYYALGRLKDVEVMQEEVLTLRKEILGARHPDTIATSNNLALTYYALGRLKDAEVLQEQVLNLRKEILGELHPDTISTSNNLALAYYALGQLQEAEALQEEVLKLRKDILGEHHPDTIAASNNLALIYRGLGRLKEAESLQLETVRQAQDLLGNEHPTTTMSMLTMAQIYESLHNRTEALTLLDSAQRIITEKLGNDHPQCLWCQEIGARVQALVNPFHATVGSPGTEGAPIAAPPSSQNAPRRSLPSVVRRLIARVRDWLP